VIIVIAGASFYIIIGGFANMARGHTGHDVLPNLAFWRAFGACVREGLRFSWQIATCSLPPRAAPHDYRDMVPGA
jgi:hypothetical protein